MAFSFTRKEYNIEGNLNVNYFDLDFDAVTEGKVQTGMTNVIHAEYVPKTSDKHGIINLNSSDAAGTAEQGSVFISSVTANDEGSLRVVGN